MEREEAINVIRKNCPHVSSSGSEFETALRALIPELAESEDERIRKALIFAVRDWDYVNGIESKKVLAYLEKQKPAEWSEEDSNMLHDIEGYVTGTGSSSGITKEERSKWLWNLPRRFNLQPKQEWSEKDEKMRERLITRLNWITYNTRTDGTSPNITFFDEIDWLKSLRPQPKQDKGPIAKFVQAVEDAEQYRKGYEEGLHDGMKRHWKPSEELYYVIRTPQETEKGVWKPSKELEEEIRKYLSDRWKFGCCTPVTPVVLPNYTTVDLKECANHFAQWGAEHLTRNLYD